MSSIVEVIRKIVNSEINKLHVAELGVVTSIFPHSSDSDKENYECNIKLKYRDLELRKVPVATQQIGLANIPNVGDLVLVTFINGDINAPVVIGRLYTDEDRPPVSKEEEIVYIPSYSKQSGLRRTQMKFASGVIFSVTDEDVTVEAGKTVIKLKVDGDVEIQSNAKISVEAEGDLSFSAQNITMESQKNMELKTGGGDLSVSANNIKTESKGSMEYKAMSTKMESQGTMEIKATGPLTVKTDATGEVSASGPLTIKGALVNIN